MSDPTAIATQFVRFYYDTFDNDRKNLANVYQSGSMLTWEGKQLSGAEAILEHLTSLPFQRVQHNILTTDAQVMMPGGSSIIIIVTGQLLVDEESKPFFFTQTFHLVSNGSGNYYISNDLFRLNYG